MPEFRPGRVAYAYVPGRHAPACHQSAHDGTAHLSRADDGYLHLFQLHVFFLIWFVQRYGISAKRW